MLVFTSCLTNYIPKARVLGKSIKKFHPDWKFILVLGETWPSEEPEYYEPFDAIVYYEDLGIPDLKSWLFKHSVVEICTAVKGFAVCHFFENHDADKVIYLDPDIQVFNSLEELDILLDKKEIILVPHHLKPHTSLDMITSNELCQMRHGIYNLGFIAFAQRTEGIKCAQWWRDRLHYFCRNDVAKGLFTDQRWCDFIPSFFDNYHILKDPGYDVASWNLTDRHVWKDQDGVFFADKSPLKFYHFTGYDSGAGRYVISHYTQEMPVLVQLWDSYDRSLQENGHARLEKHQWTYDFFEDGTKITQEMRNLYWERDDIQKDFPNPFETNTNNSYLRWFRENHLESNGAGQGKEPGAYTQSYTWKLFGKHLYQVEDKTRTALQADNLFARALSKLFLALRDRYRITKAKRQSRPISNPVVNMLITIILLHYHAAKLIISRKRLIKLTYPQLENEIPIDYFKSLGEKTLRMINGNIPTILFDLFFCRGFHGGGEYGKSVFYHLCQKAANNEVDLWVAGRIDKAMEDQILEIIAQKQIKFVPVDSYEEITHLVNTDRFDYFFTSGLVLYTGYVYQKECGNKLKFTSKYTKVIGVIHDLRDIELSLETEKYLNFRKALSLLPEKNMSPKDIEKEVDKNLELAECYQEMYSQILKNDAVYKIITVSNYSKEMIEKHIGYDDEKILTYYSPMKNRVTVRPFQFKGNNPKRINYGLMISSDRREKNAAGAIIAFDRYCTENPDSTIRLMVLGVGDLKELGIQKVVNQNRIIFHDGFIDSNKLEYLYSNALFLVYPSFSEGFGYPPLEAMQYGVPSLVSNRGAVPEIYGNAAVYCDPYDIVSIQTGFQTIIDFPPSRNKINTRYQMITSKQSHDLECLVSLFR